MTNETNNLPTDPRRIRALLGGAPTLLDLSEAEERIGEGVTGAWGDSRCTGVLRYPAGGYIHVGEGRYFVEAGRDSWEGDDREEAERWLVENWADARADIAVGDAFRCIIRQWLTKEEIAEVDRLNAAEGDAYVCHTHDYCDANEAMAEAFRETLGRDCDPEVDDLDGWLWGEAWTCAKAYGFSKA